jgi:hypothetical protein
MMDGTMPGMGLFSRKGVLVATGLNIKRFLHPIDADKFSAHTGRVCGRAKMRELRRQLRVLLRPLRLIERRLALRD